MEKRLNINYFNEVDGENLTIQDRIEELAEGMTSKDFFIFERIKYQNTREGKRKLANDIFNKYGSRSDGDWVRIILLGGLAILMGYCCYESYPDAPFILTTMLGGIALLGVVLCFKFLSKR